jgi:hypothetical protein
MARGLQQSQVMARGLQQAQVMPLEVVEVERTLLWEVEDWMLLWVLRLQQGRPQG